MSNLPQVIITADSEAVLNKKKQWAEVGLTVHVANLSLEVKAKEALHLLSAEVINIEDITAAESILKDVRAKLSTIETERKEITSKFDKVSSALMTHEKAVKDAIPAYQQMIIKVKKDYETEQSKERLKIEAEKRLKETAINFVNEAYNSMKDKIADICQKAYTFALSDGNITEAKLDKYLIAVKKKLSAKDFTIECPVTIPENVFQEAYNHVGMADPADMLYYFHMQVDSKFEFYAVALKNKDAAIQAAKDNEIVAQQARLAELSNAAIAAKLETISAEVVVDSGIKELKKKFEIDMEDNEQAALLIITAFVTNFNMAKEGLRVKSMMSLSIGQMGAALAWLKNKDNAFSFTGINFKVTEKL